MKRTFKPIYNESGEFVALHITETMTREEAAARGLAVVDIPKQWPWEKRTAEPSKLDRFQRGTHGR